MPSKMPIAEFFEIKILLLVPGTMTHTNTQVLINNDDENYVLPDTNTHGNVWIDDAANLTVVY